MDTPNPPGPINHAAESAREFVMEFHDVSFAYATGAIALERASFTVAAGDHVGIIGPNGGGKTTLLRLALGLLKPLAGTIRTCGHAPHRGCQEVGYVPQATHNDPHFPITCAEVVGLGLPRKLSATSHQRTAIHEALDRVGMADLAAHPFAALSGGQRQRLLIARALATKPRLLLLDEPNSHLDPEATARLEALLANLRTSLTVVTVTHDLNFVDAHVSRVICVNRQVHVHPATVLQSDYRQHLYGPPRAIVHHDACLGHGAEACSVQPGNHPPTLKNHE